MKKHLITLFAVFGLLLVVAKANAEWSSNLTIKHIYGGENITVYFNEALPNPSECSQGVLKVASWEGSDPAAKNFMSMMLAAKMANKAVQVHIRSDSCLWGGWPRMDVMKLM